MVSSSSEYCLNKLKVPKGGHSSPTYRTVSQPLDGLNYHSAEAHLTHPDLCFDKGKSTMRKSTIYTDSNYFGDTLLFSDNLSVNLGLSKDSPFCDSICVKNDCSNDYYKYLTMIDKKNFLYKSMLDLKWHHLSELSFGSSSSRSDGGSFVTVEEKMVEYFGKERGLTMERPRFDLFDHQILEKDCSFFRCWKPP